MDPEELAKVVSALLAPTLPYLIRGAGQAGKTIRGEVSKQAQRLWAVLKPKIDETPGASGAAADVADAPEDPDAQAAFRLQLRKLLAQDPAFLEELSQVWRETGAGRGGRRVVTVGGDVSSSVVVAGDANTLIMGRQVIHNAQGRMQGAAAPLEMLFTQALSAVQSREPDPGVDREELEQILKRLRDEIARGEQANLARFDRWLRFLAEMAPDVLEVIVPRLLDPAMGTPTAIRGVAGHYAGLSGGSKPLP
jgi:hypothetical protein